MKMIKKLWSKTSISSRLTLMFFGLAVCPAIVLLTAEPQTKRELSAYLGIYLAVAISLGVPLMGFLSNITIVNDLKRMNDICHALREGAPAEMFDLPNEADEEHALLQLKRNMNFMIRSVCGREQHLRDHLDERVKESSHLRELSVRDPLTGLYNRRCFDAKIIECAEQAAGSKTDAFLLLMDVDNFKYVNDVFGHQEGDRVIADIGRIILSCTRIVSDIPFRYGGDEFGVILLHVDLAAVTAVAQRLLDGYNQNWEASKTSLSIGIASFADQGLDLEAQANHWIRSADKAVYIAKNRGGNCIVINDNQEICAVCNQ